MAFIAIEIAIIPISLMFYRLLLLSHQFLRGKARICVATVGTPFTIGIDSTQSLPVVFVLIYSVFSTPLENVIPCLRGSIWPWDQQARYRWSYSFVSSSNS